MLALRPQAKAVTLISSWRGCNTLFQRAHANVKLFIFELKNQNAFVDENINLSVT